MTATLLLSRLVAVRYANIFYTNPLFARSVSPLLVRVANRPRFGGDSQALSWYRPAEMRSSWVGTSWKGSAGQGPAISDETGARPRVFICLQVSGRFLGR